jgi:hypothetical protein
LYGPTRAGGISGRIESASVVLRVEDWLTLPAQAGQVSAPGGSWAPQRGQSESVISSDRNQEENSNSAIAETMNFLGVAGPFKTFRMVDSDSPAIV